MVAKRESGGIEGEGIASPINENLLNKKED
jgi:hypothetical protein